MTFIGGITILKIESTEQPVTEDEVMVITAKITVEVEAPMSRSQRNLSAREVAEHVMNRLVLLDIKGGRTADDGAIKVKYVDESAIEEGTY